MSSSFRIFPPFSLDLLKRHGNISCKSLKTNYFFFLFLACGQRNVSENVIWIRDQPWMSYTWPQAQSWWKRKKEVTTNFLQWKYINNKTKKCRIQRNSYQMSKQWVKMYSVYFHKIHLRNMSHHLEQFSYWQLLQKQLSFHSHA